MVIKLEKKQAEAALKSSPVEVTAAAPAEKTEQKSEA